jgi:hypothetical protein
MLMPTIAVWMATRHVRRPQTRSIRCVVYFLRPCGQCTIFVVICRGADKIICWSASTALERPITPSCHTTIGATAENGMQTCHTIDY